MFCFYLTRDGYFKLILSFIKIQKFYILDFFKIYNEYLNVNQGVLSLFISKIRLLKTRRIFCMIVKTIFFLRSYFKIDYQLLFLLKQHEV